MGATTRMVLLGLTLVTACDGDPALDAGDSDAGPTGSDAGSARDAGAFDAAGSDAGALDASEPVDAGPSGPAVDRTDPQLHEHELEPRDLDPSASDSLDTQFAQLDTRAAPLGRLVIFLPGANNTPSNWRDHGRLLASFGLHVVIPHYNNRWGSGCSGMPGTCNADTRWEALTGEDLSPVIEASRADSAEGRVITILEHLVGAHPGGDWGYYLDGAGGLRYERIVIAGISHGASSAGLYASRRAFERAVMHSGGWGAAGDDPATPIDVWYGLSHTDDEQHAGHLSSWSSAGMVGAPTSIDGASAPFGDAHQLITSASNSYPHCSVCVHSSSPLDAMGDYVFEPAWRHMYGVP